MWPKWQHRNDRSIDAWKEKKIQCKERNKLQLTFLELSKTGENLCLKSRVHSFINREGNGIPHSSTLAWKIPWTEEPDGLQSMGSLRVRHNWVTSLSLFTFMHCRRKWQATPVFLPGESQRWRSLAGCCLLGCTESDTTEVTCSSSSFIKVRTSWMKVNSPKG